MEQSPFVVFVVLVTAVVVLGVGTYFVSRKLKRVRQSSPLPPRSANARSRSPNQSKSKPGPTRQKVFLAYRRDDSKHIAGRIFDVLTTRFGKDKVFKDVDSIPLGVDFRSYIDNAMRSCRAVVVIVGPNLIGRTAEGRTRIRDDDDHLAVEIRTALGLGVPVIPVLVDDAEMPLAADLPGDIRDFTYRHGLTMREDPHFHGDVERLIVGLEKT